MASPFPIAVATHVAQQIAGAGIVPSSTLSASSAAGASSVTVQPVDALNFPVYGFFTLWDGTSEPTQVIAPSPSSTGTIPLSFAGRSYTGLQDAHASGALCTANLLRYPLTDNLGGQWLGDAPLMSVYVLDNTRVPGYIGGAWKVPSVLSIRYRLPSTQTDEDQTAPQLFLADQLDRAERDLDTITALLETDNRLGGYATSINGMAVTRREGGRDSKRPFIQIALDLHFVGRPETATSR